AILAHLDGVDQAAAAVARARHAHLSAWQSDPDSYGRAAACAAYRQCEQEVVAQLTSLLAERLEQGGGGDGERLFAGEPGSALLRRAEHYYTVAYHGGTRSRNLRGEHMHATLRRLIDADGGAPGACRRVIVWGSNCEVGDAR